MGRAKIGNSLNVRPRASVWSAPPHKSAAVSGPLRLTFHLIYNNSWFLQHFIAVVDESKRANSENFVILSTSFDQILQGKTPVFQNASIYDVFAWMHYYGARNNLVFPEKMTKK